MMPARTHAARSPIEQTRRLATLLMLWLLAGAGLWMMGLAAARAAEGGAAPAEEAADKPAAATSAGAPGSGQAAEVDPPGRVGRIVDVQGNVSRYDAEEDRWSDAERNRPLTTGDRISTAGGSRAELRIGSTVLRLGGGTEVEVLRLDDERMALQLHSGVLAVRVRTREAAAELEVATREARLLPLRAGHYRIERVSDTTTYAGSWRGDLRVDDARRLTAGTGQRLELFRDARTGELRHIWRGIGSDDAFARWALAEDERDERVAASGHVSPEMTGAEDLDRWGQWDRHPEYGAIWYPTTVVAGWAPYRYGRWVWMRPWGWTWVDEAPWGFAPFHYGRWVHWRNRWCWAPGGYVQRPVYAPALVAWVGGPGFTVSVNIGGPTVGWVPLAPRERYVPYYRVTPVYIDRVNPHPRFGPPGRPGGHPQPVPTGPIAYSNQGVPGGVTVVPRDALVRREPVGRAVVSLPEGQRGPVTVVAPPAHVPPPRAGGSGGVNGSSGSGEGPRVIATPPHAGSRGELPRRDPPPATVAAPPRNDGTVMVPERRDRREGRDVRDGRDGRDSRDSRDARDGRPADSRSGQPPVQVIQPARPAQPAPSAQPAPPAQRTPPAPAQGGPSAPVPRVVPATPPPAAAAPPATAPRQVPPARAPEARRGGNDDDRRRTPPRERERDAVR